LQVRRLKDQAASFFLDVMLDDHSIVRVAASTRYTAFRVRQGRLIEMPLE